MSLDGPRHALIIEDEILIALEIEQLLQDEGFLSADVATTPREALICAKAHRPDLITADIRIAEGTGIEAVAAISSAIGEIPVVFVTGNAEMVRGRAEPVVEKPINPRDLHRAVEQLGL